MKTKLSRRQFIKSSFIAVLSASTVSCRPIFTKKTAINNLVTPKLTKTLELPEKFTHQVIASWGDNLFNNEDYNFHAPNVNTHKKCYGYNNDYCTYIPIQGSSARGLLCVNHEYTIPKLMFPDQYFEENPKQALSICMDSVGHSIFEIKRTNEKWNIVKNSPYNRKISANNTICEIKGAASGHRRLRTRFDRTGTKVLGTLANCSGGKTPWGTILIGEENFNMSFGGKNIIPSEERNIKQYRIKKHAQFNAEKYFKRFNISKEPGEVNKFGYLVEIDPFKPEKPPVKRTSLGRFFHEGAAITIDQNNRAIVYTGDDQSFEHFYKFISSEKYDPKNPDPDILDKGILHVAKFYEDHTIKWVPLIHGYNGLTENNGFDSQADIAIETRAAARQVGATKLDRPEGIAINPKNGNICVALTNNYRRFKKDIASPEAPNFDGYILEIDELNSKWRIKINAANTELSNPDNLTFDSKGNLYIATDGMERNRKISDSIFKIDYNSNIITRMLNSPLGSEICGISFTPDEKTLFTCVQHPGAKSSFNNPSTRWPQFNQNIPPLPSIIAIDL